MLDHILEKIKPDEDLPARTRIIDIRNRALNGTLYDVLPHPFYREESPAKEYIPLTERRPSVRSGLVKTVVDDSVSLLFSEGHFPALQLDDEGAKEALEAVIKNARIKEAMIDAATRGSVGSVAIWVRFLDKRVFVSALETTYLTPDWMPDAPDTLKGVRELRKVTGRQLRDAGYPLEEGDDGTLYWLAGAPGTAPRKPGISRSRWAAKTRTRRRVTASAA